MTAPLILNSPSSLLDPSLSLRLCWGDHSNTARDRAENTLGDAAHTHWKGAVYGSIAKHLHLTSSFVLPTTPYVSIFDNGTLSLLYTCRCCRLVSWTMNMLSPCCWCYLLKLPLKNCRAFASRASAATPELLWVDCNCMYMCFVWCEASAKDRILIIMSTYLVYSTIQYSHYWIVSTSCSRQRCWSTANYIHDRMCGDSC